MKLLGPSVLLVALVVSPFPLRGEVLKGRGGQATFRFGNRLARAR